jgi:hypothetical protein
MKLRNVRPRPSPHDGVYRAACDSELFGKVTLPLAFSVQFANHDYLFFGEYGMGACFAARLALLAHHIGNVITASTRPNMIRIDTGAIVATMASEHTLWEWLAIMDFPRNTTSYSAFAAIVNCTVTAGVSWPSPLPTIGEWAGRAVCPKVVFDGVVPRSLQAVHGLKAKEVALGVLFGCSSLPIIYIGRLAASALASAIRSKQSVFANPLGVLGYVVREVWGIIHGVFSASIATDQASGRFHSSRWQLISCPHYTTSGGPTP